ncbi:MAG: IMP cyclohydrolase [Oscillospiraceae bacterium]|nr:IMP cyclohydrolase [Oscillospiraceae bacterium]
MRKISEVLSSQTYPGRGIIMGMTPDGTKAAIAYFIMGRSTNSRNRVFAEDGQNLRAQAFDESKVENPSLIIYNAVKVTGDKIIVTNGEQTDQITALMDNKRLTFEQALNFIKFEPDPPIYTPRISAVMKFLFGTQTYFNYSLSIAKTADGNPDSCRRFVYSYSKPIAGQGHFIHTYGNDDKNLPSFSGEPVTVEIEGGIDEFTDTIWNSLNSDNKVSLFTRYIEVNSGEAESRVVNKNVQKGKG